jgi:hypothetical protein
VEFPNAHHRRIEIPLARIFDGGSLSRSLHDFGLHVRCDTGASRFAGSPGYSKSDAAPISDGSGLWINGYRHYLFTVGQTVGRSYQSGDYLNLLSVREDRHLGCRLLCRLPIRRRNKRSPSGLNVLAGWVSHPSVNYVVTITR